MTQRTYGQLSLQFKQRAARTQMQVLTQTPPLRVVRAFTLPDGMASVHLHNVSGGVLGGDCLDLTVQVDPHAQAQLTTPGATRIYRQRAGQAEAVQTNRLTVGAHGLLEYLPEAVIPFAEARYRQVTTVNLAAGAGLFWWETLAPGRTARAERFAYQQIEMTTDIAADTRPIVLERLRFEPLTQLPTALVRMGEYQYLTTFYICRVGLAAETWLALEAELAQLAHRLSELPHTAWGVSTLVADGLIVRGLSQAQQPLTEGLLEFWRIAKEQLYQTAAIPPRKLA